MILCLLALPRKNAQRRVARWAPLASVTILYVFSIEPVANALTRCLETPITKTAKDDETYDAVVLLGGVVDDRATFTYGQPSYNDSVERLLMTYDLLRAGRAKNAIISGGPFDTTRQEVVDARVLGKQLTDWGIAAERIVVEDQSRNTRENAVLVADIVHARGWKTLVVVTSAMHMPRALDCFRAVKVEIDALPVDYHSFDTQRFSWSLLPRAGFLSQSTGAIREMMGRLIYRAQGYGRGA